MSLYDYCQSIIKNSLTGSLFGAVGLDLASAKAGTEGQLVGSTIIFVCDLLCLAWYSRKWFVLDLRVVLAGGRWTADL